MVSEVTVPSPSVQRSTAGETATDSPATAPRPDENANAKPCHISLSAVLRLTEQDSGLYSRETGFELKSVGEIKPTALQTTHTFDTMSARIKNVKDHDPAVKAFVDKVTEEPTSSEIHYFDQWASRQWGLHFARMFSETVFGEDVIVALGTARMDICHQRSFGTYRSGTSGSAT